jgi:hypothetical protein
MKAGKTASAAVNPAHVAWRRTGNTFGITVSNAIVAFTTIIPKMVSPRRWSSDNSLCPFLPSVLVDAGTVVLVWTSK